MKKWEKITENNILKTYWLSVNKVAYRNPEGKIVDDYYIAERPDFIVVVPRTKDEKFVLVKQYSHAIEKIGINFPMGFTEKNESLENTAKRELLEETGFSGGKLKFIGSFLLAPPFLKTAGHVFYADTVEKNSQKKRVDRNEIDEVMIINRDTLEKLIENRELSDFASVASYLLVKTKTAQHTSGGGSPSKERLQKSHRL